MPTRPETLSAAIAGGGATLLGRHHAVCLAAMGCVLDADLSGTHVLLRTRDRSEEHTSELQSHACISYAVFCLDRKSVV
jgi:hypothetical protein